MREPAAGALSWRRRGAAAALCCGAVVALVLLGCDGDSDAEPPLPPATGGAGGAGGGSGGVGGSGASGDGVLVVDVYVTDPHAPGLATPFGPKVSFMRGHSPKTRTVAFQPFSSSGL